MSRDGLTTAQLEAFLKDHGDHLDESQLSEYLRELIGMKSLENQPVGPAVLGHFDPLMGQLSSAVASTHDINTAGGGAQYTMGFAGFADEYLAGIEAAKEVLTFLKAQTTMDLFQHNAKAKSLYEAIVSAGVNEVLYNNRRWQR